MIRIEAGVESEQSPNTPDELYDVYAVSYIRTLHVVGDGMVGRYLSVSWETCCQVRDDSRSQSSHSSD